MFSKLLPFVTLASLAFNTYANPMLMKRDCKSDYNKEISDNHGSPEVKPFKCGDHTVQRKKALNALGADAWDLSITMQETGCDMTSYNKQYYPFGDWNAAHSDTKKGDSANFSIFKLNWYQIRTYAKDSKYYKKPESDWETAGKEINASDKIGLDLLHQLKKYTPGGNPFGFYKYQRGGASATDQQGKTYETGINYIWGQVKGHTTDEYAAGYIMQCI
ncbi:uncharacterized protein KY384_006809 [Bacidia gigantensis]|uniref:uncharacterized protein n=1 Tax=Bacidia gigantensis TaxID=2732470 RepID=UPI001D0456D1|nr:uncharacterized protein KY384_006809 [Bacidia gigantensis]KAG8527893.1 hypothetical protein KY384_006809 [Bacidia gigantensis]